MPELPPPPAAAAPWRLGIDALSRLVPGERRPAAVAALAVAAALALGAVLFTWRPGHAHRPPIEVSLPRASTSTGSSTSEVGTEPLVVDAAGAVANPGVYRLPAGSRVTDLLDAAGGATDDADVDQVNLAAPLVDGQRVYVPRQGEAVVPELGAGGAGPAEPVDLNTATVEQLDALPGVGPATAQAIVTYRASHGRIRSIDELLDVRGIGPAKLDAIRSLVRATR